MQEVVIHDEALGKDFTIKVYVTAILNNLHELRAANLDPDGGDYPVVGSADSYTGRQLTQEERDGDLVRIEELLDIFEEPESTEKFVREVVFPNQPKKKNGSFAKGRVNDHALFSSFGVYWEDHYGDNTPALRSRSQGDYEATLSMEEYIVKY